MPKTVEIGTTRLIRRCNCHYYFWTRVKGNLVVLNEPPDDADYVIDERTRSKRNFDDNKIDHTLIHSRSKKIMYLSTEDAQERANTLWTLIAGMLP